MIDGVALLNFNKTGRPRTRAGMINAVARTRTGCRYIIDVVAASGNVAAARAGVVNTITGATAAGGKVVDGVALLNLNKTGRSRTRAGMINAVAGTTRRTKQVVDVVVGAGYVGAAAARTGVVYSIAGSASACG